MADRCALGTAGGWWLVRRVLGVSVVHGEPAEALGYRVCLRAQRSSLWSISLPLGSLGRPRERSAAELFGNAEVLKGQNC